MRVPEHCIVSRFYSAGTPAIPDLVLTPQVAVMRKSLQQHHPPKPLDGCRWLPDSLGMSAFSCSNKEEAVLAARWMVLIGC